MPDQDISVEETITVVESLQFLTPPPEIYADCKDEILTLRNKIMQDLVAGRIKALLDAGHDSMNKYRGRIDKLGITTYLFGDLRRKAMVIRLKGYDLGEGLYRYAKTEFDQPLASYPLTPPYNVPQRPLPQVDVFRFTALSDIDIKEMEGGASLQGIIAIQCDSDTFMEAPDAENALYDYYFLYPEWQYHVKLTDPVNPKFGIESFVGEGTDCLRQLHIAGTGELWFAVIEIWFDIMFTTTAVDEPSQVVVLFHHEPTEPKCTLNLSQYRIHTDQQGIWATFRGIVPQMTFQRFADGFKTYTEYTILWVASYIVTLSVNNPEWGHTDPVEGEYKRKVHEDFVVTAIPIAPHVLDHWELDGVNVGDENPYPLYVLKPCELKAVFT